MFLCGSYLAEKSLTPWIYLVMEEYSAISDATCISIPLKYKTLIPWQEIYGW